jgi:predicted RNA-binding Zn ribbon-like protein
MDFASYTGKHVQTAVHLVNHLTPGCRSGRPVPPPVTLAERRTLLQHVADEAGDRWDRLDRSEIEQFGQLAVGLRSVFELADQDDVDGAASQVNHLLEEYRARPELSRHDGQAWHLHFHSEDAGAAAGWGAGCATGLAVVIGGGHAGRLGICIASQCDGVYVDTSRNGSRRFCSEACMNRTKVSAFRARKTLARLTGHATSARADQS